jgi:hypothetical protein
MTTTTPLRWTILPVAEARAALLRCERPAPAPGECLGDWLALLHPEGQPDAILAWREVGEPLLRDALQSDAGPGSAARLAEVLRNDHADWWHTAHVWTAFSRWDPNDAQDWARWMADCPAPDEDRLGALLAPTRGWLLWDFQWMAALAGTGVGWDAADALRRAWNLRRPGIERQIADIRIHGVPLEHVLLRRTLGPHHLTSRVDATTVQRLFEWRLGSIGTRGERVPYRYTPPIGFTLTVDEAARVHAWAGKIMADHHHEAIEFPGVDFVLSIGPFGETLEARIDNDRLSLR